MKKQLIILTSVVSILVLADPTEAAVLIPSGGITATAGSTFNASGLFDASNTLDGLTNEGNRDAHLGTHWIAAEGVFTESITFALGSTYTLAEMQILNTSNTNWNDSETDTFTIAYSTDGTNFGAPSAAIALQDFDLGFQTVPLSGTASHVRLTVSNSQVVDGNQLGADPPAVEARVGLNEVRFSQIPEPGAVVLGCVGFLLMLRRRRR